MIWFGCDGGVPSRLGFECRWGVWKGGGERRSPGVGDSNVTEKGLTLIGGNGGLPADP